MRVRKAILLILTFLFNIPVLAQVDTAWVRRYNEYNEGDYPRGLAVDKDGNVLVTGFSWWEETSVELVTIKYAANGDTLWVRYYDGNVNTDEQATALVLDKKGNVYVTGYGYSSTSLDFITIKYAANGDSLWVKRYDGTANSNDLAYALITDDSGNVYVTGHTCTAINCDFLTIKYASSGELLWVRTFNGPGNFHDQPNALALDRNGNLYVTGKSIGIDGTYDYATIKYSPNGDTLWVRHFSGLGNGYDEAVSIIADDSGNVYVTGVSFDPVSDEDFLTIKYSNSGDSLWVGRHNGTGNYRDGANALTVDRSGNVYVTGYTYSGTSFDYGTVKYASNGDKLWFKSHNGQGNDLDAAYTLTVDSVSNVYVTGVSGINPKLDFLTIKYAANGDLLWAEGYNGPGNDRDAPVAIVIDNKENVYVVGESRGSGSGYDIVTIKYIQFECLAEPGDANGDSQVSLSDIIFKVNYIFKGGPSPTPLCRGDVNVDGKILLSDIVYLINFIFKSGPAPQKSRECCL